MIERISPPGVPAPRGPYSPAVRAGDFIFVSGQVPVDPATQQMVTGDIRTETRQTLNNIKSILEGCGAMNEVYAEFFGDSKPARATVACQFAIPGIHVEIDATAYKPG